MWYYVGILIVLFILVYAAFLFEKHEQEIDYEDNIEKNNKN